MARLSGSASVQRFPSLAADELRLVASDATGTARFELRCARRDAEVCEQGLLSLVEARYPAAVAAPLLRLL